jgi:hypothetical protein
MACRLAVVAIVLSGGVAAAAGLEGYWWGEGFQPHLGIVNQWLAHLKDDGTYEVEFRQYEGCVVKRRNLETGRWWLDGDRWRTVIDTLNGHETANLGSEYVLRRLDDDSMEYHHIGADQTYESRRVSPSFAFPRCVETS